MSNTIKFDNYMVNPDLIGHSNTVIIQRYKNDPGAFYMRIKTSGGILAILRYAYEGKAYENIKKDAESETFKLKIGLDTVDFIIGNYKHDDEVTKGTKTFLDTLCTIMESCQMQMTIHNPDGFQVLVYCPYTRGNWSYYGHRCFWPEEREHYGADVQVNCYDVRKSDEAVLAVVSAIEVWCDRVNVSYSKSDVDRSELGYVRNTPMMRDIFTNPDVLKLYDQMESMQMNKESTTDAYRLIISALREMSNVKENTSIYGMSCYEGEF